MKKIKIILITIVISLLCSCGITTSSSSARVIDPSKVDEDLFQSTTTLELELDSKEDANTGKLYLYDKNDNLISINRQFENPPNMQDILDALEQPPLAKEIAYYGFLKTELPPNLEPKHSGTNIEEPLVYITVSDEAKLREIAQSDSSRTKRIFTQIVCSLDWFEIDIKGTRKPINGVIIEDSQGPILAVDEETAQISGPANPEDFNNCSTLKASTPRETTEKNS